jgi:hypothetical protein
MEIFLVLSPFFGDIGWSKRITMEGCTGCMECPRFGSYGYNDGYETGVVETATHE